jgi:hypothetical protein
VVRAGEGGVLAASLGEEGREAHFVRESELVDD